MRVRAKYKKAVEAVSIRRCGVFTYLALLRYVLSQPQGPFAFVDISTHVRELMQFRAHSSRLAALRRPFALAWSVAVLPQPLHLALELEGGQGALAVLGFRGLKVCHRGLLLVSQHSV